MIYRLTVYMTEPIFKNLHGMLVHEEMLQSPFKSYFTHQQDSASVFVLGALHASVMRTAQTAHVSQKAEMLSLWLKVAAHLVVDSDSKSVVCLFHCQFDHPLVLSACC